MKHKTGKRYIFGLMVSLFLVLSAVGVGVFGVTRQHTLAKVFNEDILDFDRTYAQEYLSLRHNFSDIPYVLVKDKQDFTLKMGNFVDDVRGVELNNSKFAIHIVYCDGFQKFCKFRVNGVLSSQVYFEEVSEAGKAKAFDIDGKYILKVKSARFNQCDNQRFCHFGYEGYDVVDVAVERKG